MNLRRLADPIGKPAAPAQKASADEVTGRGAIPLAL
jgi:hypothetical protein